VIEYRIVVRNVSGKWMTTADSVAKAVQESLDENGLSWLKVIEAEESE
jgi:hypothetical protein